MTSAANLLADVGGTNTRLAIAEGTNVKTETIRRYENSLFRSLEEILNHYRSDISFKKIATMCFAIAGPVKKDQVKISNINWTIKKENLQKIVNVQQAHIINDLQAHAYSLLTLKKSELRHIYGKTHLDKSKRMLVCGIGTGCNMAITIPTQSGIVIPPSEAGHVRLPVRNASEKKIADFIVKKNGFPEVEQVLSGKGMALINSIFFPNKPRSSLDVINNGTSDTEARHVIDVFAGFAGSYFGDLALITLPEGGIFLAGGLAKAVSPYLKENNFGEAFCDKGRFADWNKNMAIYLINDDYAALKGCAVFLNQVYY